MTFSQQISARQTTGLDRAVARVLIIALVMMNSLPAVAGDEFTDADGARFNRNNVTLDNAQAGQTIFTIDTNRTTIEWEDLQQPANNHLQFDFTETEGGAQVLNISRSHNAIGLNGRTSSNGTVGFANPAGLFINGNAVIDVAGLVAIGGAVSAQDFTSGNSINLDLDGDVTNQGVVNAEGNIVLLGRNVTNEGRLASGEGTVFLLGAEHAQIENWDSLTDDFFAEKNLFGLLGEGTITNAGRIESENAALLSGRVVNQGEIQVQDGTILVVGADAVYVSQFDNPILVRLPHRSNENAATSDIDEPEYAIENQGTLDAGLGHVRLAASDPLGFGIRQGTGSKGQSPSITAKKIDLEGGETGRVQLSGRIDADGEGKRGEGGEINLTGSIIALVDAEISASGNRGGGTIQIGGEQQGTGDLQRAHSVIIDEDSSVRASATKRGDGGRLIVFSEELTSIDGELAARGGNKSGDGGFIETSGLLHFAIDQTPDLGAAQGEAGDWLIDPYNIRIGAEPAPCAGGLACDNLNAAIEAIIAPNFDDTGFDGILRTVVPDPNFAGDENFVSADLIERALGIGVDVTISTQVFGEDMNPDPTAGDIILEEAISIMSADVREGTTATLTLLAAGDILVDNAIEVVTGGGRSNLALSVTLVANDASQTFSDRDFAPDLVSGDVLINADVTTGGGAFQANGISVVLAAGQSIDTDGGSVLLRSGTLNSNLAPTTLERNDDDPEITDSISGMGVADPLDPRIEIAGQIDTRDFDEANENREGGSITLAANSINVGVDQSGDDLLEVVTGLITVDAASTLQSGGGDISISAGNIAEDTVSTFVGDVEVRGNIESRGGSVSVAANGRDVNNETGDFEVEYVDPSRGEGGVILLEGNFSTEGGALLIGNSTAESVQIDGSISTLSNDTDENGLIRITANDFSSVENGEGLFGNGEVLIGANANTSIDTAGLVVDTRDLTVGEASGANAVSFTLSGDSSTNDPAAATVVMLADGSSESVPNIAAVGEAQFSARRQAVFNQNTQITAETVRITAASDPLELNNDATLGFERPDSATRLFFGGTGGAAANGVRLNADLIEIAIGDRTTDTSNLFASDLGNLAEPTDFGITRQAQGDYSGLQLRSTSSATLRPEEISIRQDGDLTISSGAATGPSQIDFAGAFGGSTIGAEGMRTTLESSDGILAVQDAVGLNSTLPFVDTNDNNGQSDVILNGGLALAASEGADLPDTVVLGDGTNALGTGGTTPFDARSLTISTPGDFTITEVDTESINVARELIFEAGRGTSLGGAVETGTLTVDSGVSISASVRLALLAAASGFGDLVFAGTNTTLASDSIELRAGAGSASNNDDTNASIQNLQSGNVALRDGNGNTFGDAVSSAIAFSFRQDAFIDGETDLAEIDQFGLTETVGFRTEGDVAYSVRSDFGQVDLDSGDPTADANRFQNSALSLIGTETGGDAAIAVAEGFSFEGKRVEVGGTGDFTFNQRLASAFNRSGTDADEEITLRAGAGSNGNLDFNDGDKSSVLVKAPRINLVAGDGAAPGSGTNSDINVNNASFDLTGPAGAMQTFIYQVDDLAFQTNDLPTADQFGTTTAALPDVLAIRNDAGTLQLEDFDATSLPIDLTDDTGRLILEAAALEISTTDGSDLELTNIPNLNLRLRTDSLVLEATENNNDRFSDPGNARILIGARAGDSTALTGDDASFSARSLLIEAFDDEAEVAIAANLSRLSEDPTNSSAFDLAEGRAPTTIVLQQDGAVLSEEIFLATSVSGLLGRTILDDDEGEAIATDYTVESLLDSVTIAGENVSGSALTLLGNVLNDADLGTESGAGIAITLSSGSYLLESLNVRTPDSILIEDGTSIQANEVLSLSAALISSIPNDETTQAFGSVRFDASSGGTTTLAGNQIELNAGPFFALSDPATNNDDEREEIDPALLPSIDLSGLAELSLAGDEDGSSISIGQSANFDSTQTEGDFISALAADPAVWDQIDVASIQGVLTLAGIESLSGDTRTLVASTGVLGSVVVDMPNASVSAAPFDDFEDEVRIESNDVTFQTDDPGTSLNLASRNLEIVSGSFLDGTETSADLFRVGSDPDVLDRPIVRIIQNANFIGTEIPLPSQYLTTDLAGNITQRETLEGIEIVLQSTGGDLLTLDDAIRSRVTTANLRLISAGDVAISLVNQTEGFEDIEGFAALQLASLEIDAAGGSGTISVNDFTEEGVPANLSIETQGDLQFNGDVILEETLELVGRDLGIRGDVQQTGTPDAGLVFATRGQASIEGDVGSATNPLDRLWAIFDQASEEATPSLVFDANGNQSVFTNNDILFTAGDLTDGTLVDQIEAEIGTVATLADLDILSEALDLERTQLPSFASVGKTEGNLTLDTANGFVGVTTGERIGVAGDLLIDAGASFAAIGDVAAINLEIAAAAIGIVRRSSGFSLDRTGASQSDGGVAILANTLDFGGLTPLIIGSGRQPVFGIPNPFDTTGQPDFLDNFSVFELQPSGGALTAEQFTFINPGDGLAGQLLSIQPTGASRSDLSGANGPISVTTPESEIKEPIQLRDPDRLVELAVETRDTTNEVRLARLTGAAIINDLDLPTDEESTIVTASRLDARDAEAAIELYEGLFGAEGERSGEVRTVLQEALDQYLETTRTRRVVGFELRRFVKNRPSTLLDAYKTLEALDSLFRYHRRLGLSPGEFRRVQNAWLHQIQPDGISIDELAEAIHPSRYVRGSDILDIFGR